MNLDIVIGYTRDYEGGARSLAKKMRDTFHLDPVIMPYLDQGNWMANTRAKVTCLRDFYICSTKPVLWVDADTKMVGPLSRKLLDDWEKNKDIVARMRDWDGRDHYLTGVVYLNMNTHASAILWRWEEFCKNDIGEVGKSDEFWMEETRREYTHYRWGELPRTYCFLKRDGEPKPTENVIFRMGYSGNAEPYVKNGLML